MVEGLPQTIEISAETSSFIANFDGTDLETFEFFKNSAFNLVARDAEDLVLRFFMKYTNNRE